MPDTTYVTTPATWEGVKNAIVNFVATSPTRPTKAEVVTYVTDTLNLTETEANKALVELRIQGRLDPTRVITT